MDTYEAAIHAMLYHGISCHIGELELYYSTHLQCDICMLLFVLSIVELVELAC